MGKMMEKHSIKSNVYHNNHQCNTQNNIELENISYGKAGKSLCTECKRLNRAGK